MLYSNVPTPVALTTIVPVGVAQVGWVTVGAFTVGGLGRGLIITGFVPYVEKHAGCDCKRTTMLQLPGARLLNAFDDCHVVPPSMLYSSVFTPDANTTMEPLGTAQVGCVTVGALITGGVHWENAGLETSVITAKQIAFKIQVGLMDLTGRVSFINRNWLSKQGGLEVMDFFYVITRLKI